MSKPRLAVVDLQVLLFAGHPLKISFLMDGALKGFSLHDSFLSETHPEEWGYSDEGSLQ